MNEKIPLVKFNVSVGEGYRVDNTIYLYTYKPVADTNAMVRAALGLPSSPQLHDVTGAFRVWVEDNNIPAPSDSDDLYNYVLTVGDSEQPVVWPALNYMRRHKALNPTNMEGFAPRVVYPTGTKTMCRFGHPKTHATRKAGSTGSTYNCYKCAYWRQQGVDLSAYKPTHCLAGHSLKDNRWLSERRGKVREECVQCNNEEVMNKYGYSPN